MVALKPVPAPEVPAKKSLPDRVMALLERVDCRRADTSAEKEAIFRLRYTAYRGEDAIAPSPSERFCDALDHSTNAWIFGLYIEGELASSIRLHVANCQWPTMPALDVFSDLLSPEAAVGKTIVDPTRFVVDRTASRRYPELCYVTTRLAVLASENFRADLLLATVRAEHQAFYRRVFGHRLACEPRNYPSLSKPICLMALDYPLARERLLQRHPFFRSTVFERRKLFGRAPALARRSAAA
jgi:N-acyl-L-homoserine lactone synthetase